MREDERLALRATHTHITIEAAPSTTALETREPIALVIARFNSVMKSWVDKA